MKLLLAALALPVVLATGLWAAVSIYSPLAVFSALVPVDGGVSRVAEAVPYGSDPRQTLDVYRPDNAGPGLPVVVFCYGGAWDSGAREYYTFAGKALAARGYLASVFDYRLVPQVKFPGFVEDTAAAISWAVSNAKVYGGDGSRIFLVGHSAGAYNVAMATLAPGVLERMGGYRAAIRGLALLAGPADFLPLDDPATIAAFSGVPDLPSTQPINLVTGNTPPILLLHGDADTTVGLYNSRNLAARLDSAGVRYRLKEYQGLGHADILTALSWPLRWRAPVLDDITEFFSKL